MITNYEFDERTGLLVIDVQKAFDNPNWGKRNNPGAEIQIAALLAGWREKGFPVFHVRHASAHPEGLFREGEESFEFKDEAKPLRGEAVYKKSVNSAFIGTALEADLRGQGIHSVVIVGLTTNHCVSTTTRTSGNLGFRTFVVDDATASFDRLGMNGEIRPAQEVHASALSDIREEFATVVSTADVLQVLGQAQGAGSSDAGREAAALPAREAPSPEVQAYIDRIVGHLQGRSPVEVLRSSVETIEGLVRLASAEALRQRPMPEKWSANEIVAHLADTETVLGFRLRQILSQNAVEIASFDQDRWANVVNYQAIPAARSAVRFGVNRAANLELIEKLTPEQMTRYGVHSERGRETLAHLCRLWAGHDLNHIAQLRTLLA